MKIVRESLFEVLRSENDWANQQIARNVDRYKSEIKEEPAKEEDFEATDNKSREDMVEAMKQFMLTTETPFYIQNMQLDSATFQIDIEQNDDYAVIVIKHEWKDHDLEHELFQIFQEAFKAIIGKGEYKNVKEIVDSEGNPLFIV